MLVYSQHTEKADPAGWLAVKRVPGFSPGTPSHGV